MPQNCDKSKSEDFISKIKKFKKTISYKCFVFLHILVLSFEIPVIPMVVSIFETYTPGSVVRISGKVVDLPDTKAWRLLWEGLPQNCNGVKQSRLFTPQIRFIGERIK